MSVLKKILPFIATIFVTAALIYLTPLKNIAVIEPTITDVSPTDFYEVYKQNPDQFIFLDVRSEDAYRKIHATGSKNQPLHTLYFERKNLPKRGKTIVLICSGGAAAGVGFSYLQHYGFFNIIRIEGGIENWQAKNLPVETSSLF